MAAAALYFLITRLIRDWSQIPFDRLHFNALLLAASYLILLLLHFPLGAICWRLLLRGMGENLSALRCMAIMTVTQLGKYAPGKVWFTLGRMSLAKREGVSEDKTLVSVAIETGFLLLAAILLFAIAVAVLLIKGAAVPPAAYAVFALIPLCLVVVYPPVLNRLLRFLLPRLRRPVFALNLSYPRLLGLLGCYTLDWLVQGLGCYVLINSFYPLAATHLPVLLGAYSISWILGFIFLIAPAGLGIREGIYTWILKLAMPETVAIISALITRVWMTTSEVIMALSCLPLLRRQRQEAK
ncbi:MAG: lysylphosphatidylglycerol synthase domain-containing protein [candidate division WOR-3 bacterium]